MEDCFLQTTSGLTSVTDIVVLRSEGQKSRSRDMKSSAITFTSHLRGRPFSGDIYRQLSVDERRWTSDKILQILQNWTPVADKKLEQETHQEMSRLYPSVSSLYFATLLRLSPRRRGSFWKISVKFCTEDRGWLRYKMRKNTAESFNLLSRACERLRRQTDLR